MKNLMLRLAPLAVLFCAAGALAAGTNEANVARDYTDIVAPAEMQAYVAGMKAYNQCLAEHGFKYAWTAWMHETGNTYAVSYDTDNLSWADFDAMHKEGQACDSVFGSQVNPHLKSETSAFYTQMPGMIHMSKSMMSGPASGLIVVVDFTLKPGREAYETFTSDVKMLYRAMAKSNWPGYSATYEVRDAGAGAPDFVLVLPNKNWAELGSEIKPPLWTMVAKVYGQKKADEIRKSLDGAIANSSSHVDSYDPELAYIPRH